MSLTDAKTDNTSTIGADIAAVKTDIANLRMEIRRGGYVIALLTSGSIVALMKSLP